MQLIVGGRRGAAIQSTSQDPDLHGRNAHHVSRRVQAMTDHRKGVVPIDGNDGSKLGILESPVAGNELLCDCNRYNLVSWNGLGRRLCDQVCMSS